MGNVGLDVVWVIESAWRPLRVTIALANGGNP